MRSPNENGKQPDNVESQKQQTAACGPECGCHNSGAPGKTRWVIGAIVLIAAGVLVVRAVTKGNGASTQTSTSNVAASAASQTSAGAVTTISALSELNVVAANTDVVFIFLPSKGKASSNPPSTPMKNAANTIESKTGSKCGLFTLKTDSPEYDNIAAQVTVPGVLAMVKGAGTSTVSGDITESKLVQGYVAASRAAGCGAGGCCAGGCKK